MTDKSYVPLITESILKLGNDIFAFRLIWALGAHSDPLGMSFAGHARLATYTHRAKDSIHPKLIELSEMDIIRCHVTKNSTRYRVELTYQLSMDWLHIRPELREDWYTYWQAGKPYLEVWELVKEINSVSNVPQPAGNRYNPAFDQYLIQPLDQTVPKIGKSKKPKNRLKNQSDNPNQTGHGKAVEQATDSPRPTPANGGTHAIGATENQIPPRAAAPPPFDVPLEDTDDEMCAWSLATFGSGTTIKQAREAVWQYGKTMVKDAMQLARAKAQTNPIGYVMRALREGWIKPRREESDWQSYLYDEFGNPLKRS